ncbi:MAG: matrixin family metalloprotease [Bacteriovoracaceae bacterium]
MKFILTLSLLFTHQVYAFTFNNSGEAYFNSKEVVINISNNSCNGIEPQELFSHTEVAIKEYWNKVPTSKLKLKMGGIINDRSTLFKEQPICDYDTNCNINSDLIVSSGVLISCNNDQQAITDGRAQDGNFPSQSILAKSIPNNTSGNHIIGSLILVNGKSDSSYINLSADEKIAVIAHELGHAIGLGHSPVKDSLMYYESIPSRRSLGWDDIDGLTYLYPAEQPFGSSCGTITEDINSQGPGPFLGAIALGFLLIFALSKRPQAL